MDDESTLTFGHDIRIVLTLDQIADELSEEYVLGGKDNAEFAYLGALAIETLDNDDYDIERTLMEFLRNSQDIDLTRDECDKIEAMLR